MHRQVAAIANRLSLRPPQRQSLEILDRLCELVPPRRGTDVAAALAAVRTEFPKVTDFERDFPSLCFALATGVGKTRLMGAFISYLHTAHGIRNFFVLAPNLTIYNKLITDFTPNTPKYVFKGIAEFATYPPAIITGDNYEALAGPLLEQVTACKVNIFNISKINTEVRGGQTPRIKRLSEYIGQSYFEYLASLPDLVLIMDESHRYRASAGVRAINELKPILGLEVTATPFVEGRGRTAPTPFRNVVFDYPLGRAIADGFVKKPAVVTRRNFNAGSMSLEAMEQLKLEDGVALHEAVKVELATYARETGDPFVKPFLLVIARDTTHAGQLLAHIQSDTFFEGRYRDKVIQVDSSRTGAEEDQMVERLLKVEHADDPTEIVIHVNMLKEGWDVTNLYTIVPLRAANARTLMEQSIGRGLRLPYGRLTGVEAVDRLNIIAHDRFQEIVDDARKADSPIRLQEVVLCEDELGQKTVTVVVEPGVSGQLGLAEPPAPGATVIATPPAEAVPFSAAEQEVARVTATVISALSAQPERAPTIGHLRTPEVQAAIVQRVQELQPPAQLTLEGVPVEVDVAAVVARTCDVMVKGTIGIPRILLIPKELRCGFHPFTIDFRTMRYAPVSEELWIQHLAGSHFEVVSIEGGGVTERRLEDYVVRGLVDFSDVNYDQQADLLYDLASQVVTHLRGYLTEEQTQRVLQVHQKDIARFVHAQMLQHYWETVEGYEVEVRRGFEEMRRSAFTMPAGEPVLDHRQAPPDKSRIARYVFGGFSRCLYPAQKFQSDTERAMALILDRESERWFKPAKGQFRIDYRTGFQQVPYVPDFVAETADEILLLETKARNELDSPEVVEKARVAREWCGHATEHAKEHGAKPWRYVLIPHDVVAENMSLSGLVSADRA
jgi:type III restriction enzyme